MRLLWPLSIGFPFLATLLVACNFAFAEPVSAKHAQIELVAQQDGIAPGGTVMLGVHFVLDSGWHIYWINPGDSGQPPQIEWQLPPGFLVGKTQWPRPERMQSTPQMADFGYHQDVLLMASLQAPQHPSGQAAEIRAQAKWLICREVCLPDRAQLNLSLPLTASAKPDPSTASSFAAARKLVPQPLPKDWSASAVSHHDDFMLTVRTGKREEHAEFFPLEPAQMDNAAPQKVLPLATGLRITLKKSELLVKPIAVLRGVLVLDGSRAYVMETKISSQ